MYFEYGWNKNLEAEFTYERYLHDYLRVFGGVNIENETRKSLDKFKFELGVAKLFFYIILDLWFFFILVLCKGDIMSSKSKTKGRSFEYVVRDLFSKNFK